ncbi:MAG: hypothetical protein Q8N51_09930, partial [Gammaproteobacteria bacterium]|nr:hypothetical protein [Gammaproteobacteria bacterium]
MLPSIARQGGPGAGRSPGVRLTLTIVLLALFLGGCVVRVVYNQLDWLTLWYVDDYFDLDGTQKAEAGKLIASTLAWHRSSQLPHYVALSR